MKKGFTLIELLVVISIIGILIALSIFGLQSARQASRDARRKADLEQIRSGLEIYRSDCNSYPVTLGDSLEGSGDLVSCPASNTYISKVPKDPAYEDDYPYSSDGITYTLCAELEKDPAVPEDCSGVCASCNYKVTSP